MLRLHVPDIAALDPPPAWLGVLSSSGVYGDYGGAWIDESRAPRPGTDDDRRRIRNLQKGPEMLFGSAVATKVLVMGAALLTDAQNISVVASDRVQGIA